MVNSWTDSCGCGILEQLSEPPSIKVIQWSSDDAARSGEVEDDDDLSLYIGAENTQHRLLELRSYRDLSNISFADVAVVVGDPQKQGIFPVVLHHILSIDQFRDSIAWRPCGRAFAITNVPKFFANASHMFFCTSDYDLFIKWVRAYGFQSSEYYNEGGSNKMLGFYHERFLRFRPWLAFTMTPHYVAPSSSSGHTSRLQVSKPTGEVTFLSKQNEHSC